MTESLNITQDEILFQIKSKHEETKQLYQNYDRLLRQINDIKFRPRRIIIAEIPEKKDDKGNITQMRVPPSRNVVYDIRPQTKTAPIRDLTDDEIEKGYSSIKKEFESI